MFCRHVPRAFRLITAGGDALEAAARRPHKAGTAPGSGQSSGEGGVASTRTATLNRRPRKPLAAHTWPGVITAGGDVTEAAAWRPHKAGAAPRPARERPLRQHSRARPAPLPPSRAALAGAHRRLGMLAWRGTESHRRMGWRPQKIGVAWQITGRPAFEC